MKEITLNDQPHQLVAPYTVASLLAQLQQPELGIAVAVNDEIVSRQQWPTLQLDQGDQITLFQAIAGG